MTHLLNLLAAIALLVWGTHLVRKDTLRVLGANLRKVLAQSVSHKHRFSRSTAVWTLWAAVLLLNIPALMDSLAMTVFNQTSEQTLSYSPPASPGSVYIQFAVYGIATVGVIGIIRGLCLLRDTPNQSMNLSRCIVHLFGGILAVNLVTFLRGIGATLGGDVQTTIAKIIG